MSTFTNVYRLRNLHLESTLVTEILGAIGERRLSAMESFTSSFNVVMDIFDGLDHLRYL